MENKQSEQNWLQRIQEQSWEPELFISGILLFALFQIPDALGDIQQHLDQFVSPFFSRSTIDEIYLSMINTSVYFLIFGLIVHIFLRTIWVAFLGINYVYKDGIILDALPYKEIYKRRIPNSDFVPNIHKLERYSSLIFSFSYLGFAIVIGTIFGVLVLGVMIYLQFTIFPDSTSLMIYDRVFGFLILVYLADLATAGMIRSVPYLNKAFLPIHYINRYFFLVPLYEKVYLGLISNHKRWKVVILMSCVVVALILGVGIGDKTNRFSNILFNADGQDNYFLFSGHYKTRMGGEPSRVVYIDHEIIASNVLRISLPHDISYEEEYIEPLCDYNNQLKTNPNINVDSLKLECLNAFYDISIDDSLYLDKGFYYRDESLNREGLRLFVDISHLNRGLHTLYVKHNFYNAESDSVVVRTRGIVEFFKENEKLQL